MFCPQCKAEYRFGFTRCHDCDVDLVERLPETDLPSGAAPSAETPQEVWAGDDQAQCVSLCEKLQAAEIPYQVIQRDRQCLKGVDQDFKLCVPPDFQVQAREIIDADRPDFPDAEAAKAMELPAEDDLPPAEEGNSDWTSDWYPEDATVEIYSENSPEIIGMIEASLRENLIRSRTEAPGDGSSKLFVLPADESRAREIVRQITEGAPSAPAPAETKKP